jgi:hypothetical protein
MALRVRGKHLESGLCTCTKGWGISIGEYRIVLWFNEPPLWFQGNSDDCVARVEKRLLSMNEPPVEKNGLSFLLLPLPSESHVSRQSPSHEFTPTEPAMTTDLHLEVTQFIGIPNDLIVLLLLINVVLFPGFLTRSVTVF